jgi:hypothetical protein
MKKLIFSSILMLLTLKFAYAQSVRYDDIQFRKSNPNFIDNETSPMIYGSESGGNIPGGSHSLILQGGGLHNHRHIIFRTKDETRLLIHNNGNVGVGTISPNAKLEVSGGFRVSRSTESDRFIHTFVGSNNAFINYEGGNSTSRLGFQINGDSKLSILHNGFVGIGTTSPSHLLTVNGDSKFNALDIGMSRNENSNTEGLNIRNNHNTSFQFAEKGAGRSHAILFNAYKSLNESNGDLTENGNTRYHSNIGNHSSCAGGIFFRSDGGIMDFRVSLSTGANNPIDWGAPNLRLLRNGNVGIGVENPGNYRLNVWGRVRAHEIVVNTTGADFVFEEDYTLRPLSEVEAFIKANKHLPEIPSAKEMQEEGVGVSELQTKLLQKIEELTLYMIELEKKNNTLEKENKEIKTLIQNIK